ncbi:hypothetical protein [Nostoc sp. 'Peltigera membranacea cyanobiont' 232]|uniref:hypothetical protein n=1 Tax=Nostoc sp. 'Peltigera membranacea cyanobiont' 232 TaxID=2014531 RepID=UPI000B958071|nr:hypothetical protein [Nostoc sp. 'Peltigera membranacea cyanobiont' 232]OYE06261.1 hypothetical protein CDG79_02755 [Nostoc sp. 'Peltigera membranacea cyanobiont' 232]
MKIDQYPAITTVSNDDLLLVETISDSAYKKVSKANLLAGISGGGLLISQLADIRPNGVSAGSAIQNTWTSRTINTVRSDDIGLTLANNTITLGTGKYYLNCNAEFYLPVAARLRLQNTSNNSTVLLGMASYSYASYEATDCHLSGVFSLESSSNLQIQYYFYGSNLQVHNLGVNSACGVDKVYLLADIFKVG